METNCPQVKFPWFNQPNKNNKNLINYAGMKVVFGQKRGNQVEIIKPTANFRENADFLPIKLAL